ncbi:MAG: polynucleotide adenylyltransferase, partial [Clostridiales bacterium]|nr:polynucleotide adenylyltransferase [Clostridiales bacterium]
MFIDLPASVQRLLGILNKHGYEAFVVGGCVRDSLMGRIPYDWDIATSALPCEIKACFPHTFDAGIAHGTVTVVYVGRNYEITTYRVDGEYEDGRHPKSVSFTASLEDDLARRDFTMNALAWHPNHGLVDPFGGLSDIESGIIRGVGRPDQRFEEDALRMMRAVRFSGQLGFQISPETLAAIIRGAAGLKRISAERIRDELTKLLLSPHLEKLALLTDTGLISEGWPLPYPPS